MRGSGTEGFREPLPCADVVVLSPSKGSSIFETRVLNCVIEPGLWFKEAMTEAVDAEA